MIDGGVCHESDIKTTQFYDPRCRVQQCLKCQGYGRKTYGCKNSQRYAYCAQDHRSESCPHKQTQSMWKCGACRDTHKAFDPQSHKRRIEKEIIGTTFVAIGVLYTYLPVQLYLVDTYTVFAASANGACTIVRSIFQALLPLCANPLYSQLSYGWGNSVLCIHRNGILTIGAAFDEVRGTEKNKPTFPG